VARGKLPLSTSSIPSTFKDGFRNLPVFGQRDPGPPLVKKDGVVVGEVGRRGCSLSISPFVLSEDIPANGITLATLSIYEQVWMGILRV
jgi:hypothetical protein